MGKILRRQLVQPAFRRGRQRGDREILRQQQYARFVRCHKRACYLRKYNACADRLAKVGGELTQELRFCVREMQAGSFPMQAQKAPHRPVAAQDHEEFVSHRQRHRDVAIARAPFHLVPGGFVQTAN
jgi:hypothetical protein